MTNLHHFFLNFWSHGVSGTPLSKYFSKPRNFDTTDNKFFTVFNFRVFYLGVLANLKLINKTSAGLFQGLLHGHAFWSVFTRHESIIICHRQKDD